MQEFHCPTIPQSPAVVKSWSVIPKHVQIIPYCLVIVTVNHKQYDGDAPGHTTKPAPTLWATVTSPSRAACSSASAAHQTVRYLRPSAVICVQPCVQVSARYSAQLSARICTVLRPQRTNNEPNIPSSLQVCRHLRRPPGRPRRRPARLWPRKHQLQHPLPPPRHLPPRRRFL